MKSALLPKLLFLLLCMPVWFSRPTFAAPDRKFSLSVSGGMGYLADKEWFRDIRARDLELAGQAHCEMDLC